MKHSTASPSPRSSGLCAAAALLLLAACSSSSTEGNAVSAGPPGTIASHPDASTGSQTFVVESNSGGRAPALQLLQLLWGRLVDVYDVDDNLQNVDYVVGEDIVTDNVDFRLTTNPVTSEVRVTILHQAGSAAYEDAFRRLDRNLVQIQRKSLATNELPPFSLGPRNAAFVLRFNDLIDPASVRSEAVRLLTGNPPSLPFTNVRLFPDPNHGDLGFRDGVTRFYSTRVILDPTISSLDVLASQSPLQVNASGLPPSIATNQANAVFRLPTRRVLPADRVLTNLDGKALDSASAGNLPIDGASQDLVRAFRSGGNTAVTGDPRNGFLLDLDRPQILGTQPTRILSVSPLGDGEFLIDLSFDVVACALNPRVGDIVQQQCRFLEVISLPLNPPAAGVVQGLRLRMVFPRTASDPCDPTLSVGPALYQSPWNPIQNFGKQGCFARFSPAPLEPPAGSGEIRGVLTGATVSLAFSEPMDPTTLAPFDTFTITRVRNDPTATDRIVGNVNRTGDLQQFTFVPSLPLAKASTGTNAYFLNVSSGTSGPTDLAGNPLLNPLPQVEFRMLAGQPDVDTGGLALRFDSFDEIPDGNNGAEVRGQILLDLQRQIMRPRPVLRSQVTASRSKPVPSVMNVTPGAIQTPLSALGSKMHQVWRYFDLGFGLLDEASMNMDVEGIYWAPRNAQVFLETYDLFEIRLAHSRWLPDEAIDPTSLLPVYPQSGLVAPYENNLLDPANDPLRIVHPRGRGYTILPNDLQQAADGLQIMPYPLNRGLPQSQFVYYTWRDTSLLAVGGPSGSGANPDILGIVTGVGTKVYGVGAIPSIGLPILMEFRCFPTSEAIGLNGFDTNFAVASSPRPNFRAFSTGGIDPGGLPVSKNPDTEPIATGGFNPNNNGATTPAADNTFYLGALDLVTRVSRAHTIWFDTGSATPSYVQPVIEPRNSDQPQGTSLLVAFRGATQVTAVELLTDASCYLNPYGNPVNACGGQNVPAAPVYLGGDATWRSDIVQIQGARFFQARMTFLSNAQTGLTPTLSSFGVAYQR